MTEPVIPPDAPDVRDALLGRTIGSYRVRAVLGTGGMGVVYLAEHTRLGHEVALKVLHASAAHDPEMVTRFENEARAVAGLGHQHIVKVFDFGELEDGRAYFAMERLKGRTLIDELAERGPMTAERALRIVRQVAVAIAAAHDAGIVHRDLKPDNIFLIDQIGSAVPVAKVLDFGIAKLWRDPAPGHTTQAGAIFGTPEYISPEQGQGLGVDGRSDLYSLGVVLWQALTGTLPFVGPPGKVVAQHILDDVPDVRGLVPDVAPAVAELLNQLVAKDPANRIQTAELLVATIDDVLDGRAELASAGATTGPLPLQSPSGTLLGGLSGVAVDRGSGLMRATTLRSGGALAELRSTPTIANGELVTPRPRRAWRPALLLGGVAVLAVAFAVGVLVWSGRIGPTPEPGTAGAGTRPAARPVAPGPARGQGATAAAAATARVTADPPASAHADGAAGELAAGGAEPSPATASTGAKPLRKKPRAGAARVKPRAKAGAEVKEAGDAVLRPGF